MAKEKKPKVTVRSIRKELAILIESKKNGTLVQKEINIAVESARQEINAKYGKGWRESYPSGEKPKSFDEDWNEKNLDGTFAYNGVTEDF